MFLASSPKPIDPQLMELVEEIEQKSSGLSVLAARQFRYSLEQTPVEVTISESRNFNVLEEFILRAGLELSPPPTENELAIALGLDPVFVQNTVRTLRNLQTLTRTPESQIVLTPQGHQFYEEGSVPQPPKTQQIYAIADPLQSNLFFLSSPLEEVRIDIPDLEELIPIENRSRDVSYLDLEELQQLVRNSGLGLHLPEEGKIVTLITVTEPPHKIWQALSLFVIFDTLESRIILQVRRGKKILEYASDLLDIFQSEGILSLTSLFDVSNETIAAERDLILKQRNEKVEVRFEKIEQQAIDTAKISQQTEGNKGGGNKGEAILLRDSQIRKSFLDTLNSAKQNILIFSPWVNEAVVDNAFIRLLQNLAKQGVFILIGHGISQKQEDEDKPIPPKVERQLQDVKTPDGLPAIQIFWLGNSHAKEVVVDRKVHLCGSHNWLSYRGDRLPRGETVYKVTIPEQVEEAYEFLAKRFKNHAQKLWQEALLNHDSKLAVEPMCVWGALSLEEEALKQLHHNKWLELLPIWLLVVRQGLRSKKISPNSACFKTALSLLSQISAEYPDIDLLREGWQKVMGAIASQNRTQALSLLSDEAWSQFTRLGIAQLPINSPDKFISKYTVKQPEGKSKPERKSTSDKKNKSKK